MFQCWSNKMALDLAIPKWFPKSRIERVPLAKFCKNRCFGGFWGIRAPPDSVLGRLRTGFPGASATLNEHFCGKISELNIGLEMVFDRSGRRFLILGIDGAIWNRSVESSLHASSRSSKFSTNHKRFVTCFPPRVRRIKNWNWVTFFTRIVGRHKICKV